MSTLGKPNHCSSSAVRWRTDGEMGDVIDVGGVVKHLNQFGGGARVILGGGVQLGYSGSGPAGNDPHWSPPQHRLQRCRVQQLLDSNKNVFSL